jgi:hypothetical protein
MLRFIEPRLRKPAGIALFGTAYAVAWLVHGGHGWLWAIVAEIGVIALTVAAYVRGGRDSDEDALYGTRADERQQLIGQRSWALNGKVTMVAAFLGLAVAVADRAGWWWPFAVILAIGGFSYLLGLSNFGVGEELPADDADDGHQARFPVTR